MLMGDKVNQQEYYATRLLATNNFMVHLDEDGATITCTALLQDGKQDEFSRKVATSRLSLQGNIDP